jgi:hypothetical protein
VATLFIPQSQSCRLFASKKTDEEQNPEILRCEASFVQSMDFSVRYAQISLMFHYNRDLNLVWNFFP